MTDPEIIKEYASLIAREPEQMRMVALNSGLHHPLSQYLTFLLRIVALLDVLEILQHNQKVSYPQFLIGVSEAIKASMINIWDIQRVRIIPSSLSTLLMAP
jgi:hypothetical protein